MEIHLGMVPELRGSIVVVADGSPRQLEDSLREAAAAAARRRQGRIVSLNDAAVETSVFHRSQPNGPRSPTWSIPALTARSTAWSAAPDRRRSHRRPSTTTSVVASRAVSAIGHHA